MTVCESRLDWTRREIAALFDLPFGDVPFAAHTVHLAHHPRNEI